MAKKISIGISILVVAVLLYVFVLQPSQTERVVEPAVVENNVFSLSFDYLSGPDGYELIESGTSDDFVYSYVLIQKSDLEDFQSTDTDTAPPTMSLFVFNLPAEDEIEGESVGRISRLQNWAQSNAGLTSFDRIYGTPEIIELDGVKSLEYTTDGTYQQSVFLVSYRGLIYMFVGQYDRPTDIIKKDFENLMQSLRFE